jgi:glucosamine kinase
MMFGTPSIAPQYFVGVDGGATRCRVRLRDAGGRALGQCVGPAANIYVDFSAGMAIVRDVVGQAIAEAAPRGAAREIIALGLGLAGVSSAEDAARVVAALPGFARVEAVNDAVTACIGASGLGDGGLVIAGTGSAGIARVGGKTTIVGGRGFLIGDDGSGARIGADAMRAAMRACDGLEPLSGLSHALLTPFDFDPTRIVRWAATAKPNDYGAVAPQVFAAAGSGDSSARAIIEAAAEAIAALARAVFTLGAPSIALVGGVAEPLRAYLPADLAPRLHAARRDAVDGAILLVGGAAPESGNAQ